jgi:hypothetical protein
MKLIPLTEMSGDHFTQIFHAEGFSPSLIKRIVESFDSLYGFHKAVALYGRFESQRLATELAYDVEFTIGRDVTNG